MFIGSRTNALRALIALSAVQLIQETNPAEPPKPKKVHGRRKDKERVRARNKRRRSG